MRIAYWFKKYRRQLMVLSGISGLLFLSTALSKPQTVTATVTASATPRLPVAPVLKPRPVYTPQPTVSVRPAPSASGTTTTTTFDVVREAPASQWQTDRRFAEAIYNVETGQVVAGTDVDELRHPASMTKLMTAYLIFAAMDEGRLTPQTRITASAAAVAQERVVYGVRQGQTLTVDQALRIIFSMSANDVTTMLAESMGETEADFAARMTDKAHELGAVQTVFRNASGLPNPQQVTTAREMSMLIVALQRDYPQYFRTYIGARQHRLPNGRVRDNCWLCQDDPRLLGHKTGYIFASNYNMVALERAPDGTEYVAIVFGAEHRRTAANRVLQLLDYARTDNPQPIVTYQYVPVSAEPLSAEPVSAEPVSAEERAPAPAPVAANRPASLSPAQAVAPAVKI